MGRAPVRAPEGTMPALLRDDRRGVSPVVAVILLVAITVILAAVLYAMASGLFSPNVTQAEYLGVSPSLSPDGKSWIVTVVSVPPGLSQNQTTVLLRASNGSTVFPAISLSQLEKTTLGVEYVPSAYGPTNLAVNDRIVVSIALYPYGTQYVITGVGTVLATGTL